MFAIIVTGGKQYKVQEGDVVFVEKLDAAEGETVKFDEVLAVSGESFVTRQAHRRGRLCNCKRIEERQGQKNPRSQIQIQEKREEEARSQTALYKGSDRKDLRLIGYDKGSFL